MMRRAGPHRVQSPKTTTANWRERAARRKSSDDGKRQDGATASISAPSLLQDRSPTGHLAHACCANGPRVNSTRAKEQSGSGCSPPFVGNCSAAGGSKGRFWGPGPSPGSQVDAIDRPGGDLSGAAARASACASRRRRAASSLSRKASRRAISFGKAWGSSSPAAGMGTPQGAIGRVQPVVATRSV